MWNIRALATHVVANGMNPEHAELKRWMTSIQRLFPRAETEPNFSDKGSEYNSLLFLKGNIIYFLSNCSHCCIHLVANAMFPLPKWFSAFLFNVYTKINISFHHFGCNGMTSSGVRYFVMTLGKSQHVSAPVRKRPVLDKHWNCTVKER